MLRLSDIILIGLSVLLTGVIVVKGEDDAGVEDPNVELISANGSDDGDISKTEEGLEDAEADAEDANAGDNDGEEFDNAAKTGHSDKQKTKKTFVPVYAPTQKEKKKMKIISVDKGFYIPGGTQVYGKFKSLKACMKACAGDPTCFQGDYNPWLHKCYTHTNYTACGTPKTHPQFVHFSKVPCCE